MTGLVLHQPKWFLEAKRGIGMTLVALSTGLPMLGAWMGINLDPAHVGEFVSTVTSWMDTTGLVIGFGLWIWGSFFPTAPLSVLPPKADE